MDTGPGDPPPPPTPQYRLIRSHAYPGELGPNCLMGAVQKGQGYLLVARSPRCWSGQGAPGDSSQNPLTDPHRLSDRDLAAPPTRSGPGIWPHAPGTRHPEFSMAFKGASLPPCLTTVHRPVR